MPAPPPNDEKIAGVIREWQKRLLQLDRRNNLLYFRSGRTVVHITEISLDEISSRLASQQNGLSFDYAERRVPRPVESGESGERDEPTVRIREGHLNTDHDPLDLQKRLRSLQRKEREWDQEQGINVLFLALGFLHWVDQDGEKARSPLVLFPCDLRRTSPRDNYYLVREDDDALTNVTLAHELAQQGIDIPEYGDSQPEEYLSRIAASVHRHPEWQVCPEIWLGTFALNKIAMWRDLDQMRRNGVDHTVVRQMATGESRGGGDYQDSSGDSAPTPLPPIEQLHGGRLDDLLPIKDQYAVLPADFSQIRAIESARSGTSLVIHGPPGTGKSQTISNIIATLLADGKNVLFVSEKRAALDVVKRRLDACGLGMFCLDLHSGSGRKSQVYDQLGESLYGE